LAKKAPDAFRTISEVSEALDTPAHVLRFWESKFSQVKPVKRAGGRRYYRPDDVELLSGIKALLHEQGMTIKGAQKLLREKGVKHVAGLTSESNTSSSLKTSKSKASPIIEAKPIEVAEDPGKDAAPTLPFSSKPKTTWSPIDLPSLDVSTPDVGPGLLSSVAKASQSTLSTKADELAPIVAKLEALHKRMHAS